MSAPPSEHGPPECEVPAATDDRDQTHSPPSKSNAHDTSAGVSCPPANSLERLEARCAGHRRAFNDGERCFAHLSDADRVIVADMDARAPGIGLVERDDREIDRFYWPFNLGHRTDAALRLLEWAERLKLRFAHAYGHCCPGWLTGGDTFEDCPAENAIIRRVKCEHADACPAAWQDHIHAGDQRCPGECACWIYLAPADHCPGEKGRLTVFDHLTIWEGPHGLRLGVGQPYFVGEAEAQVLAEFQTDPRLAVQVLPPGSGWYAADTWMVCVVGFSSAAAQEVAA